MYDEKNNDEISVTDIKVGATRVMSRTEYDHDPEMFDRLMCDKLRAIVANHIVKDKIKHKVRDDYVQKRIDLYAASPDVFWRLVQEEATRISTRYRSLTPALVK